MRQTLGASLLAAGHPARAEREFLQTLTEHPNNGYAFWGLSEARKAQGDSNGAAAARRFFNNAVSEFNAVRRQFPTVLFAGMFGFGADKPFFDVGEGERVALNAAPPTVKF